jgi:hypothetical protein
MSEGVKSRILKLVFAIMNKPLQKADELAAEIIGNIEAGLENFKEILSSCRG